MSRETLRHLLKATEKNLDKVVAATQHIRPIRHWNDDRKQLAAFGDVPLPMMITVAAETTSLCVAFWQDVHRPTTHEFGTRKRDIFSLVTAAVGFADACGKRDAAVFVTHEPSVRNRAADHVACQILV
ncbi:MAG TPA: hypothetical protein PLY87_31005 [Planctomycetaceae bacterium]|nr:hypothetical protein [Planctomycetaceae bacterium]